MPEAFLRYISSQLPFLDTIWQSEWYLTNGSGHNQIKIHLTILNEIFSHIQQIFSCAIFNFYIQRMLEAFWGDSEPQLPVLDAKEGGYFAQQMGAGTNTIKLKTSLRNLFK